MNIKDNLWLFLAIGLILGALLFPILVRYVPGYRQPYVYQYEGIDIKGFGVKPMESVKAVFGEDNPVNSITIVAPNIPQNSTENSYVSVAVAEVSAGIGFAKGGDKLQVYSPIIARGEIKPSEVYFAKVGQNITMVEGYPDVLHGNRTDPIIYVFGPDFATAKDEIIINGDGQIEMHAYSYKRMPDVALLLRQMILNAREGQTDVGAYGL